MAHSSLIVADRGAVRTLTVSRPDRLNTLDGATMRALSEALTAACDADGVRVVVLTGAGPTACVADADIHEMNGLSAVQGRDVSLSVQRLMRQIERMPKPVIARFNGFALGGGLEWAMGCDLRIAADNARFGQPEISSGLNPGFGGSQRLLRLCGRAATPDLCLPGSPIDANHALLDAVHMGGECSLEAGLDHERAQFGLLFATDDMREGTRAFPQRRPAHVEGR